MLWRMNFRGIRSRGRENNQEAITITLARVSDDYLDVVVVTVMIEMDRFWYVFGGKIRLERSQKYNRFGTRNQEFYFEHKCI